MNLTSGLMCVNLIIPWVTKAVVASRSRQSGFDLKEHRKQLRKQQPPGVFFESFLFAYATSYLFSNFQDSWGTLFIFSLSSNSGVYSNHVVLCGFIVYFYSSIFFVYQLLSTEL